MANENEAIASQAVEAFKSLLEDDVRNAIGDRNFAALNKIVCEALSEHSEIILERLETVIKQLRSEVDRPALEL